MGKRTINLDLSVGGVEQTLKEVTTYKAELTQKITLLREKIAERVQQEAQQGFNGAIVDDITGHGVPRPASVDVIVRNEGNSTFVIAVGGDAVWVEFGAGVYHNGSVGSSPHPEGAKLGMTIGGYGQGYGSRETWGFYEDGELLLTHGTPAEMPMSQAMSNVLNDIYLIAREVFA